MFLKYKLVPEILGCESESYCVQNSVIVKQRACPCCNCESVWLTLKYHLYSLIDTDTELDCDFASHLTVFQGLALQLSQVLEGSCSQRGSPGFVCRTDGDPSPAGGRQGHGHCVISASLILNLHPLLDVNTHLQQGQQINRTTFGNILKSREG